MLRTHDDVNQPTSDTPLLFDHYAVERALGSGAMGVVYLARDLRIGRLVALKTLRSRGEIVEDEYNESFLRFRREAQVCASLLHPNIVTLYEVGSQAGRFLWMAMEYVEGESLGSMIERLGRIPIDVAARIIDDVLRGLSYAHEHGVIHRDVKPGNVLVATDGTAKIADFGIAHATDANLTDLSDRGRLLGTPHYMSPEQIAGRRLDPRSDQFAVGAMFYEMVTGRKPFDSPSLTDVLYSVVNRAVAAPGAVDPSLPAWCDVFVRRLLEKRPEDRYASADEARRTLRQLSGLAPEAERPRPDVLTRTTPSVDLTPTTPLELPVHARVSNAASRTVRPMTAFAIIAILGIVVAATIVMMVRQIDSDATAVTDPRAEQELVERRQLLREAQLLAEAGAYEQAIDRYDAYLERWPDSQVAVEGRARAIEALGTRVQRLRTRSQSRDAQRRP